MAKFKKAAFTVIVVISIIFVYLSYDMEKKSPSPVPLLPVPSPLLPTVTPVTHPAREVKTSVFVPYWAQGKDNLVSLSSDTVYYFGIAPDRNGTIAQDAGYQGLDDFHCPGSECILVLRMLDGDVNSAILENAGVQRSLIRSALSLAGSHSFSGIALDLEENTLLSEHSNIDNINKFVQLFYTMSNTDYKTFSFIVYGDTYFRKRPYDMKTISASSDTVLVMAYDFIKSYGEPGPNFPFDRAAGDYGYDFRQMVADFSLDVPKDKLAVIFGMYGYDWTMNAQGTPLKRASALTDMEIRKLVGGQKGQLTVVPSSREKKFEYRDADGQNHIVWYEDEESAAVKKEYLRQQGIGMVSYWAYGYY